MISLLHRPFATQNVLKPFLRCQNTLPNLPIMPAAPMSSATPEFNSKHTYAGQGEVYYNDGRETELLTHIFNLPHISTLRNSPSAILREIDLFAQTHYLMNIGELKGSLVTTLLNQHRPAHSLELGGYIGYSALLFGSTVKAWGGRYTVIEHNPIFAGVIMVLCHLAGLDNVDVVIGNSTDEIRRLWKEGRLGNVEGERKTGLNFVFMDHLKPIYTDDLMVMEDLGAVRKGSVVVGDNMVKPGNPRYREYVEMGREERKAKKCKGWWKSECVQSWEPQGVPDAIEISEHMGDC